MKRRLLACAPLALAVLLVLAAVPPVEKPNFLLVTIDTWRADFISASGSGRVQTPFLDRLAHEGSYLQRVDAPTPLTTPSHASILTGLYPVHHGIRDNTHFRLKDSVPTLGQALRQSGYRTAAVVSAAPLRKPYGLDRGFDRYDDRGIGVEGDEALVPSSREADVSAGLALEAAKAAGAGPLFLWLHLYDPHYPYTPPAEFRSRFPKDPYAGEVARVDRVLSDFVPRLLAGRKGRWIVLVTGDHGEGLGERGEMTHGFLLYKQTREVPLLLWDSSKKAGRFGAGPKSLVDVFPTVLELLSLPPKTCDGISLFRDTVGDRWLFSESLCPLLDFGLNPALLARRDDEIYIRHGTAVEVFRGTDEERDLSKSSKALGGAAEAELEKHFGAAPLPAPNLRLTEEELRGLTSLGYIGSSSGAPRKAGPCDLREFSRDFTAYYSRAGEERGRGLLDQALLNYDRMIARYPGSPVLHLDKGYLFMQMKRLGDAEREFLACLKLDPENSNALLNLGNVMDSKGRYPEAEKYYLSALSRDGGKASAHFNLGILYAEQGKRALAVKHLKRFLELAPEAPQRNDVQKFLTDLQTPR